MDKYLLSLLVPCYNERDTIETILKKVMAVNLPEDTAKEIIIVDDGSFDGTKEILTAYETKQGCQVFYHKRNRGKGAALRTAFARAKGDFVLVQDADLEYDPGEIPKMLNALLRSGKRTAIYGSRRIEQNRASSSLYRFGALLITKFFNLVFRQNLTDLYTCYKMFPREALREITLKEDDFSFDAEITCQLVKNGYQIKEVAISYCPRSFAEGKKIRWWHGLKAVFTILKQRFSR